MLLGPESLNLAARATRSLARRTFHLSYQLDAAWVRRQVRQAAGAEALRVGSYTHPWELSALYKLAATCPPGCQALEIGSHLGVSACYIAAGLQRVGGRLVCVDTWQNDAMGGDDRRDTFAEFLKNTALLADRITPVRKNSRDIVDADVPGPFAFGFIDGDHSYDATRSDLDVVASRMEPGAMLAFHDSLNATGVGRVVGEALASGSWVLSGQLVSLTWLRKVA
jgi:predicted O-methyltransferase YrrM